MIRPVHWFVKTRDRPAPYLVDTVPITPTRVGVVCGFTRKPANTKKQLKCKKKKNQSTPHPRRGRRLRRRNKSLLGEVGSFHAWLGVRDLQHLLFFPFLPFPSPNQLADPQGTGIAGALKERTSCSLPPALRPSAAAQLNGRPLVPLFRTMVLRDLGSGHRHPPCRCRRRAQVGP